jgi:hypothetical protein
MQSKGEGMKPVVEVITHAYAAYLPQYAGFLRYQLASLLNCPPVSCHVRLMLAVASEREDPLVWAAINDGMDEAERMEKSGVSVPQIVACVLPKPLLFRRSIFRHKRCEQTDADVLYFADVDYAFGPGCLENVAFYCKPHDSLCFPETYWIHKDHATGDAAWQNATGLPGINPMDFIERSSHTAIGGMQIIGSEKAREIGYLPRSKWQEPVMDTSKPFADFRDDVTWRRHNFADGGRPIAVPNLYRLRHTKGTQGQ